jgi:hypothetical protein
VRAISALLVVDDVHRHRPPPRALTSPRKPHARDPLEFSGRLLNRKHLGPLLALAAAGALATGQVPAPRAQETRGTSTEWRDDAKNTVVARELNRAYARLTFSRDYEGVLDHPPLRLDWEIGPNTPIAWKGGATGIFGDEIVIAGGLWMPGRKNLAYAYNVRTREYREVVPPPYETAYTQGVQDRDFLYLLGGRSAARRVAKLGRAADGSWSWTPLESLPEAEGKGRWLAATGIVPGRWLFLVAGHPTGTQSEIRDREAMPDWRLRLDRPGARWERMAPYPGGPRALVAGAAARGKLYCFGGSHPDPVAREVHVALTKAYGIEAPNNGVPNHRDAYVYDPARDRWSPIRRLPFPMSGGSAVVLDDRYILLMGSCDVRTFRVGRSHGSQDPMWRGYGDVVLCYDLDADNYTRVGVMVYGVATCPWVTDGRRLYGFGGEPAHGYNMNTENVLQIATIERLPAKAQDARR